MRDQTLGGLAQTLGNLAQNAAQAFNAQANANAAYPPPTALTGRDTGLIAGDALNFTGKTTIAVTDPSGNLVSRVDVDFGAGTLSVDGGASVSHRFDGGQFFHRAQYRAGRQWQRRFRQWPAFRFRHRRQRHRGAGRRHARPVARAAPRAFRNFSASTTSSRPRRRPSSPPACPLRIPAGWRRAGSSLCRSRGRRRYRQTGQRHHHGRPDHRQCHQRPEHRVGRRGNLHLEQRRFDLHRKVGALPRLSAQCHRRYHPARNDRRQLHEIVRHRRQQSGQPGGQFRGDARRRERTAAHRISATPKITGATVAGDTIITGGDNSGAIALQNVITATADFHAAGGISAQTASLSDYAATFYQQLSTQSNAVTAEPDHPGRPAAGSPIPHGRPIPASVWMRN